MRIPILFRSLLTSFGFAALSLGSQAFAGNFEVSPIRVDFDASMRSSVLTIRNLSADDGVVVQARVVKWTQVAGEDVITATTDLIVNPPIFTLGSNSQQIVRIGPRDAALAANNGAELPYRLILSEIPKPPSADFRGVGMTLTLSVPIFFAPSGTADQPLPQIATSRDATGRVIATVTNTGTKSFKVTRLTLANSVTKEAIDELTQVRYLLPASSVTWVFKPPLPTSASFTISVMTERGVHSIEVKETQIGSLENPVASTDKPPNIPATSRQGD